MECKEEGKTNPNFAKSSRCKIPSHLLAGNGEISSASGRREITNESGRNRNGAAVQEDSRSRQDTAPYISPIKGCG